MRLRLIVTVSDGEPRYFSHDVEDVAPEVFGPAVRA
jgi:hypothetical protein